MVDRFHGDTPEDRPASACTSVTSSDLQVLDEAWLEYLQAGTSTRAILLFSGNPATPDLDAGLSVVGRWGCSVRMTPDDVCIIAIDRLSNVSTVDQHIEV
jgi:hypothetical protein